MTFRALILAVSALLLPAAGLQASEFTFPAPPKLMAEKITPMGSYGVPLGPFTNGAIKLVETEGRVVQRVWKIPVGEATTLQILDPLRAQLGAAGYSIVFECKDRGCGGFDFRFGIEVMPEPEMHVDLGDFRFLTARRMGPAGEETICLLVSKGDAFGYVQVARIGEAASPAEAVAKSTKSPTFETPPPTSFPAASVPADSPVVAGPSPAAAESVVASASAPAADPATPAMTLATRLESRGAAILSDVNFATGSAALSDVKSASLAVLADYLGTHPDRTVMLVGHTDAKGTLAGNIALSRRRAKAVMAVLVKTLGVNPKQVSADGVGYLAPMASNLTDGGRRRNRRVEVVLTSTN